MSNLFPNVHALLQASVAVRSIIGNPVRCYRHGTAPQDVQAPYVTWFIVSGLPENHLDGTPPVDRIDLQIDCWSDNAGSGDRGVQDLAVAVRDAIEPFHHITSFHFDGQDPETKRFRVSLSVTVWHPRTY